MNLAVIPARGGSKRIPRKNIRPFAGRPIMAYPIDAAQRCGLFDRVIVSTEDEQVAEVAARCGAEVPFIRPARLADDYTPTSTVVKHAVNWFVEQRYRVEYVCCIYPTAPFLQPRYLQAGFQLLCNSGKSFAFTVTTFAFPAQRAVRINSEGCIEARWPEYARSRSQDLEELYHDAGQFYWGRCEAFQREIDIFSSASVPVILPRHLVQDIDTPEDWGRAELMYAALTADTSAYER